MVCCCPCRLPRAACEVGGISAAGVNCPGYKAGQGRENIWHSKSLGRLGHPKRQVACTEGLGRIIHAGSPRQPGRSYQGCPWSKPRSKQPRTAWPHRAGHPRVALAVSPGPREQATGGNRPGGEALSENFAVAPSLPPAPAPFPAGPRKSNWRQHVRSAADGRCVTGTAGRIWHTGVGPVPASCPAAPRYLWLRDERGEESPSSLGAQRGRQLCRGGAGGRQQTLPATIPGDNPGQSAPLAGAPRVPGLDAAAAALQSG